MAYLDSRELHFAPGRGPFHVKGTAYIGLLDHCATHVKGGLDAILAKFGEDEALVAFFRQRFLAGSWYDVGPSILLTQAAAVVAGVAHLDLLRQQARAQAERDIHGVYRLLLKLARPEMIMARLPRAAGRYFDFVRAEVSELRPGCWESRAHGVPAMAQHSYMAGTEAFVVKALELSGAKEVKHRWLPPEPEGQAHGVDVMCLRREVGWK
jgi:hypothetical protein